LHLCAERTQLFRFSVIDQETLQHRASLYVMMMEMHVTGMKIGKNCMSYQKTVAKMETSGNAGECFVSHNYQW